jgi:carbon monoxide dehydrogenase subunit G
MELSGEHRFAAPRERVWEMMLDPDVLQACLPGCEKLELVGPDEYTATMKIGVAMIRGTFQGRVKITDKQEPESYRMRVEGKGSQGEVSGEGSLSLADSGGETVVTYTGEANVRGTLARVGTRVMQPAARMIVGQFFECLDGKTGAA